MKNSPQKNGAFDHLVGQRVAAVTFIWEYYQLLIGTETLTIYAHPQIVVANQTIAHGDPGYRDTLCERIGAEAIETVDTDEQLAIALSDGSRILVSFRPEDRVSGGPESLVATNPKGRLMVVGDSE